MVKEDQCWPANRYLFYGSLQFCYNNLNSIIANLLHERHVFTDFLNTITQHKEDMLQTAFMFYIS